jgi:hypothetical protein
MKSLMKTAPILLIKIYDDDYQDKSYILSSGIAEDIVSGAAIFTTNFTAEL